ncbi:MAG: hypothetical protein WC775_05310 [Patescibacteria group bacterium]
MERSKPPKQLGAAITAKRRHGRVTQQTANGRSRLGLTPSLVFSSTKRCGLSKPLKAAVSTVSPAHMMVR